MRAYKVYYKTAGKTDSMILLVGEIETTEEALAKKDEEFSIDSAWCKIVNKKEIPLSNVRISDLSITEFRSIMRQ